MTRMTAPRTRLGRVLARASTLGLGVVALVALLGIAGVLPGALGGLVPVAAAAGICIGDDAANYVQGDLNFYSTYTKGGYAYTAAVGGDNSGVDSAWQLRVICFDNDSAAGYTTKYFGTNGAWWNAGGYCSGPNGECPFEFDATEPSAARYRMYRFNVYGGWPALAIGCMSTAKGCASFAPYYADIGVTPNYVIATSANFGRIADTGSYNSADGLSCQSDVEGVPLSNDFTTKRYGFTMILSDSATYGDANTSVSTTTAANAAVGVTVIKLASMANIAVGDVLRIGGANPEEIKVKTVGTAGAGGTGITLYRATSRYHANGSAVSTVTEGRWVKPPELAGSLGTYVYVTCIRSGKTIANYNDMLFDSTRPVSNGTTVDGSVNPDLVPDIDATWSSAPQSWSNAGNWDPVPGGVDIVSGFGRYSGCAQGYEDQTDLTPALKAAYCRLARNGWAWTWIWDGQPAMPPVTTAYCDPMTHCPTGWSQRGKGASNALTITPPAQEGDYALWMWVTDNAGNESAEATARRIRIDNTAPAGSIELDGGHPYTADQDVTLGVSVADLPLATPAGVHRWRWKLSTAGTWCSWQTGDGDGADLDLGNATCGTNGTPAQGSYTVEYQVQDYAGNTSGTLTAATLYDTVAPAVTWNNPAANGYRTATPFSVSWAETETGSGVDTRSLSIERASASNSSCSGWTIVAGGGEVTSPDPETLASGHCYRWTETLSDRAGNIGYSTSPQVIIDTVPPSGTIIIDAGNAYALGPAVVLGLTYSDPTSGLASRRLSNANGSWDVASEGVGASRAWSLSGADGTKTVYYQLVDRAGNVSVVYTDTITLDTTDPVLDFTSPDEGTTSLQAGTGRAVTWTATDETAGIAGAVLGREKGAVVSPGSCVGVSWAADGTAAASTSPRSDTGLQNGTCYRWNGFALDLAGRSGSSISGAVLVDTTVPVVTWTAPAGATMQSTTGTTLSWTESVGSSGLASRSLQRQRGLVVSPGSCAGVAWASDGAPSSSISPVVMAPGALESGYCYRWIQALTNGAGSIGSATSATLLVDTTNPAADFTAPDEGTTTAQAATGTSVTWTETPGPSGIASRSLQRQRGLVVTPGTCAGVAWTADGGASSSVSPVAAGGLVDGYCYRWVQTLQNGAGTSAARTSGSLLIDTRPVTIDFTAPDEGTGAMQATATTSVTWTESAGSSGIASRAVQRQRGAVVTPGTCAGVTWASDGAAGTGPSPVAEAALEDATCYRWTGTMTNGAGVSDTSTSGTILVDTSGPVAAVLAEGGATWADRLGITIDLTATDAGSGVAAISIHDDATDTWAAPGPFSASHAYTLADGVDGPRTVRARVIDAVGNFTEVSDGIILDRLAPVADFTSPDEAALGLAMTGDVTVSWTEADELSGVVSRSLQRRFAVPSIDGDCTGVTWADDGPAGTPASPLDEHGLVDGCYQWVLTLTDGATNSATWSSGPLIVDAIDPTVILSFDGDHTHDTGSVLWFNSSLGDELDAIVTGADAGSGVATVSLDGLTGTPSGWDPSDPASGTGTVLLRTYTWGAGAADTAVSATATDRVGRTSTPATRTLTGDAAAPSLVWQGLPAGTTSFANDPNVSLAFTLTDTRDGTQPGSGIASSSLHRFRAPVTTPGSCPAVGDGDWVDDGTIDDPSSPDAELLANGFCYYWRFAAADRVGNTLDAGDATTGRLMIDTVKPAGFLTLDGGKDSTRTPRVTVAPSASDELSGVWRIRFASDGGYDWSGIPWTDWTPGMTRTVSVSSGTGTYLVLAQVKDRAGNVNVISQTIGVDAPVMLPNLGAGAVIVDCDRPRDASRWVFNHTGTIYWSVDRPLCLVPTVRLADLARPGTDESGDQPLYGRIESPVSQEDLAAGGIDTYKLVADPNDPTKANLEWPDGAVDRVVAWDPASPEPWRFDFGSETSFLSTSLPYVTVPFEAQVTIGWFDDPTAGSLWRDETVTPSLELHIVVKNSGAPQDR